MLKFFLTEEGLVTLIILIALVGWALGIWAIATKTSLAYGSRVAIGVGFAVGLPFMIIIWISISTDGYSSLDSPRFALILLAFLFVCIGVGIWALLRYAPIPYSEKVSIAVGMGVGIPCLYTLWVWLVSEYIDVGKPIIVTAILLGALAPTLWAILTKSSLDQDVKVSLSVGLGVGLPCLVPIYYLIGDL